MVGVELEDVLEGLSYRAPFILLPLVVCLSRLFFVGLVVILGRPLLLDGSVQVLLQPFVISGVFVVVAAGVGFEDFIKGLCHLLRQQAQGLEKRGECGGVVDFLRVHPSGVGHFYVVRYRCSREFGTQENGGLAVLDGAERFQGLAMNPEFLIGFPNCGLLRVLPGFDVSAGSADLAVCFVVYPGSGQDFSVLDNQDAASCRSGLFHRDSGGLALNGEHTVGAVLHSGPGVVVLNLEANPPADRENAGRDADGLLFLLGEDAAFDQLALLSHGRDMLLAGVPEVQDVCVCGFLQVVGVDDVLLPVFQLFAVLGDDDGGPAKNQALVFVRLENGKFVIVVVLQGFLEGSCWHFTALLLFVSRCNAVDFM